MDESGFSQRPSVHRTWAPRGQTPVIRDHAYCWQREAASAALLWRPDQPCTRWVVSLQLGSIRSAQVVEFLRQLRRHVRGPVVLLWDSLPGHHSGETQAYLHSQSHWLQVHRLPGYAPELNPVEGLWSCLSGKEMANYSPDTLGEVCAQVRRGMRRLRRQHDLGLNLIQHAGLLSEKERLHLCETQ